MSGGRDVAHAGDLTAARTFVIVVTGGGAGSFHCDGFHNEVALGVGQMIEINVAVVVAQRGDDAVFIGDEGFNAVDHNAVGRIGSAAVPTYLLAVGAVLRAGGRCNADHLEIVAERIFLKASGVAAHGAVRLIGDAGGAGGGALKVVGLAPDVLMAYVLAPYLVGIAVSVHSKLIAVGIS